MEPESRSNNDPPATPWIGGTPTHSRWHQQRRFSFHIGRYNFLTPEGVYAEMLDEFLISPLPNSPPHMLGVTNLRGNLIPVYQIQSLLKEAEIPWRRLLVIGTLNKAAALLIEDKPIPISADELHPAIETISLPDFFTDIVTDFFSHQKTVYCEINEKSLFDQLAQNIQIN